MKAIVGEKTIEESLGFGGISCIFWTLLLQITFKYIFLTLQADNHGEGGIFSLYALVRRYGKNLVISTILGAKTLLADDNITPPISVAPAVEGLQMVIPNLPTVPIVIIILSLLFFFCMSLLIGFLAWCYCYTAIYGVFNISPFGFSLLWAVFFSVCLLLALSRSLDSGSLLFPDSRSLAFSCFALKDFLRRGGASLVFFPPLFHAQPASLNIFAFFFLARCL